MRINKNNNNFVFRFTEMPTNNFVESSFWNFDSLFQPQQHPARDAHDTFFMAGQGYTCFVDTFSYNLGQKVLLKNFALSYPQYTYPTDLVLLCCSVEVRNYRVAATHIALLSFGCVAATLIHGQIE